MNPEQQRYILEHTFKQLTEFCGKPPVGSVAPWWEVSKEGTEMLLDKGIIYGENREIEKSPYGRCLPPRPLVPPPR